MKYFRVRRLALRGLPRHPLVQLLDQHYAALDRGHILTARCLEWGVWRSSCLPLTNPAP